MSIIGPRPALWNQDDLYEEREKYGANSVVPGLTGWAQINGRDELEIDVKAKHYCINKKIPRDTEALSQRWAGFGQNLAYFIHANTDVVVLTIFTPLTTVSIYSVFYMVIKSLKSLAISVSAAILPSFGNVMAGGDENETNKVFDLYEFGMQFISVFLFTCCILVVGIDNMNDYYDVSIKEWRLAEIEKELANHPDSSWTFVNCIIFHQQDFVSLPYMVLQVDQIWHILDLPTNC